MQNPTNNAATLGCPSTSAEVPLANPEMNLPQLVARSVGTALLAEYCGFGQAGATRGLLARQCLDVAAQMPAEGAISAPGNKTISREDFLQVCKKLMSKPARAEAPSTSNTERLK